MARGVWRAWGKYFHCQFLHADTQEADAVNGQTLYQSHYSILLFSPASPVFFPQKLVWLLLLPRPLLFPSFSATASCKGLVTSIGRLTDVWRLETGWIRVCIVIHGYCAFYLHQEAGCWVVSQMHSFAFVSDDQSNNVTNGLEEAAT